MADEPSTPVDDDLWFRLDLLAFAFDAAAERLQRKDLLDASAVLAQLEDREFREAAALEARKRAAARQRERTGKKVPKRSRQYEALLLRGVVADSIRRGDSHKRTAELIVDALISLSILRIDCAPFAPTFGIGRYEQDRDAAVARVADAIKPIVANSRGDGHAAESIVRAALRVLSDDEHEHVIKNLFRGETSR